jgi:hypothetical protein
VEIPLDNPFRGFHRILCSMFDLTFRKKFDPHIHRQARYHLFCSSVYVSPIINWVDVDDTSKDNTGRAPG